MTDPNSRPPRRRASTSSGVRRRSAGPTLARLIAVRVLERVQSVRAYADLALNHSLAQSNLPSADRALATELVYGTLRWRGRLDYLLQGALDRKLSELEPLVTTTLRLGAYQIFFSDRIPDNAAVDESVRCARAVGAERATGLVNAVLRQLIRKRDEVSFPDIDRDPLGHLEHALSLPPWLAERWLADYGPEAAAALARASNAAPPLCVRSNPRYGTRDELLEKLRSDFPEAQLCRFATRGIVLGRKGDPGRDPLFRAGQYTVQDEASQLVVDLLDVRPEDQVLDVCAAPGTKTTAIAEMLGESGRVLALDRHRNRLNLVARGARRLGLVGIATLHRDATAPLDDLPDISEARTEAPLDASGSAGSASGARFDRVLVDAPCSGLGALRRNPDARWRIRPQDPGRLARVQSDILAGAARVLRPGGSLVYSTCTLLREENDDVVKHFLENHSDFRRAEGEELPAHLSGVSAGAGLLDAEGFMRCFPHLHDTDGFFAAKLIRQS